MASDFTQKGKLEIGNQALNLVSESALKIMLVNDTYSHDKNRDFIDDGTANDMASKEISVTNYTPGFGGAGRKTLAGRTLSRNDGQARIEFKFNNATWTSLGSGATIGGVGLVVEKTTDGNSWVVGFDDTNNVATNGGDITYAPHTDGLLHF